MKLRNYQKSCIEKIGRCFQDGTSAILCSLATGSGKTVIFSKIVDGAYKKNKSVLCIVKKNILITQTLKHFEKYIDDVSIYNAGLNRKEFGKVTIASIQSLARCNNRPKFDIVILDEAHSFAINDIESQIRKVLSDELVIGFTATPFDLFGPDKFFKQIHYERTIKQLTDENYLVPLRYVGEQNDTQIDLSSVQKASGDYVLSQLSNTIMENKDKIHLQLEDAISKSQKRKKIIILCTSIEHAEYIYKLLPESVIVHSKANRRDEALDQFINGDARFLVSVLVASEGFDAPIADCLFMFRPTRSHTLYIQAAGRLIRPYPGKENGLFLDYGGIVEALGTVETAYSNGLTGNKKDPSIKVCPYCGEYNRANATSCRCGETFTRTCTECLSETPLGNANCVHCGHDPLRVVDLLKNLTEKSYGDIKEMTVTKVTITDHVSKNGNKCHRIDFYGSIFDPVVTQFVLKKWWAEKKFTGGKHKKFKEYVTSAIGITYATEGRFYKVFTMESIG
jgi:DNA repair protein RadD